MTIGTEGSRYATAGAVFADDVRFHIKDHAYLPDGDAGTDLDGAYRADHRQKRIRTRDLPLKGVLICLALLIMLCAGSVLKKVYQVNDLTNQVSRMQSQMAVTAEQTLDLRQEAEKNRDLSRIGYIAVHELGMVASDDTNMVKMYVPAVERFSGSIVIEKTVYVNESAHMMEQAAASR